MDECYRVGDLFVSFDSGTKYKNKDLFLESKDNESSGWYIHIVKMLKIMMIRYLQRMRADNM